MRYAVHSNIDNLDRLDEQIEGILLFSMTRYNYHLLSTRLLYFQRHQLKLQGLAGLNDHSVSSGRCEEPPWHACIFLGQTTARCGNYAVCGPALIFGLDFDVVVTRRTGRLLCALHVHIVPNNFPLLPNCTEKPQKADNTARWKGVPPQISSPEPQ